MSTHVVKRGAGFIGSSYRSYMFQHHNNQLRILNEDWMKHVTSGEYQKYYTEV